MTDTTQKISVENLAKILLVQSMVGQLPDEDAIFDFVCRGLEDMPGVGRVHAIDPDEQDVHDGDPPADRHRFSLQLQGKTYAEIVVDVDDEEQFLPYLAYIKNLCFMVTVVLEERRLRRANERHHQELERRVQERTRQLTDKQRDLDHAQAVAHMGNWRFDVQHNELVWSDEAYRIFGMDRRIQPTYEMLLGFVHPDDRAFVDKQWAASLEGKPYDIDHRILVNGAVKWVREKAELEFDKNGTLLGGFGTVQDITDRKRLEFDLLTSMRAAEEANRIKSQFLANMSHELRTPLTVIMGALQLMNTNVAPSERQRLSEIANGSADQLLQIISDLLDFSHIDAGRLKIEEHPFALRKHIEQAVGRFTGSARDRGIEIEVAISPDLPVRVVGDPTRIEQVLMSLVGNAVKFTERGRIKVAAVRQDGDILFTVRDTGIGIPPEKMDQIFDPFTQADGSLTRPYGGTGLGLAISKELVELMGGMIRVESDYGRGSTFSFTLPFKNPHCDEEAESPAEVEKKSQLIRVLLAEDVPTVRDLVKMILNHRGIEVVAAENGFEALALWRKEKFDLILMDLQMPEMDGLEATRKIREIERGRERKTCIFALTAHARPENREECLKAGMDGFLTKPIRIDELDALIQRFGPFSGPVCGLSDQFEELA